MQRISKSPVLMLAREHCGTRDTGFSQTKRLRHQGYRGFDDKGGDMRNMQKRWVILGLAGIPAILPVMSLADPVVTSEKSLPVSWWTAILAWLTTPVIVKKNMRPAAGSPNCHALFVKNFLQNDPLVWIHIILVVTCIATPMATNHLLVRKFGPVGFDKEKDLEVYNNLLILYGVFTLFPLLFTSCSTPGWYVVIELFWILATAALTYGTYRFMK